MICGTHGPAVFSAIRALLTALDVPARQAALYERMVAGVEDCAARTSLFMPIDVPVAVGLAHDLDESAVHQAAAACTLLWAGADLMDDIADGDARDDWDASPHQLALLYTNLLATLPHLVIDGSDAGGMFSARLAETLWLMSLGQFDDLESERCVAGADDYLALIAHKTGAEVAFFASAPALLAGLPQAVDEAWQRFGVQFGCMVQLFTDIQSTFDAGPGNDLRRRKRTLPVLYTCEALAPDARLAFEQDLIQAAATGGDEALPRLFERMHACAAVRESLTRVELFRYRAAAALPVPLESLAGEHPLRRLLKSCSIL